MVLRNFLILFVERLAINSDRKLSGTVLNAVNEAWYKDNYARLLYMRYCELVLEALEDENSVCPVCRGICNCSLCRNAKGWLPTGPVYTRIGSSLNSPLLIQTRRSEASPEKRLQIKHLPRGLYLFRILKHCRRTLKSSLMICREHRYLWIRMVVKVIIMVAAKAKRTL